jgi:uncharacterized membrane protein AbrB (regulator of aidB expression)
MASWSDVANKLLDQFRKRPKLTIVLLVVIIAMGCGGGWLYLRVKQPAASPTTTGVQSNGSNNQSAGKNDGTMIQTNK